MFKSILWEVTGKFGGQIVSFILSIVLSRILSPAEFGIMGIALVAVQISSVFVDLGFRTALVQRLEVTQVQYSSVFFLNAVIALALAAACFFLAAPLAHFYGQPRISGLFKVLSLNFVLSGMALVPGAILLRELKFRENSTVGVVAAVLSGGIGVWMAYHGFGVWALVGQTLSNSAFVLIGTFLAARWLPLITFSARQVRPLFQYGSRLFASSLIDIIFVRIDILIIGKLFPPAQLGYYTRAQSFDGIVRQFSAGSMLGALFPYIAKNQEDKALLRAMYERYLHLIMFVSIGISGALFLTASDLFVVLFSQKWQPAAPLYQILAIGGFVWPVSALMCNMLSGIGDAAAFLRLEIIKKAIFLPIYLFGFWAGLVNFVWALMVGYYIAVYLNALYLSRALRITVLSQLRTIGAYLLAGSGAVLGVWALLPLLHLPAAVPRIIINGGLFSAAYLLAVSAAKLKGVGEIKIIITKLTQRFS